jgi:hypothetical protein
MDTDDTYFLTVKELVFSFRKGGLPEEGLSKNPARQTVDELVMERAAILAILTSQH